MHNVLHIAGLRKRLAAFGLMLVLLGSLFIPQQNNQFVLKT